MLTIANRLRSALKLAKDLREKSRFVACHLLTAQSQELHSDR